MKFTTLYKKNTQGKIEMWSITFWENKPCATVSIIFGEKEGKRQQKQFVIKEGKNIGKKNETTVIEQAQAEAQARFEKQLKKGYVKSIEDAQAGVTDKIIQGGLLPMLAHKFEDYNYLIQYPVFVQPKLDGQRCIAIKQNNKVTLWTRTRKQILSVPHIIEQLETLLKGMNDFFLDGELYLHGKDNFEEIMSAVRKQKPSQASQQIEFHVYDCEFLGKQTQSFADRIQLLLNLKIKSKNVKTVKTFSCQTLISVEDMQKGFISDGYEGLMIRNADGVYKCGKRSTELLKMKTFDDAEFTIVGFEKGKDNAVVAICLMPNRKDQQHFKATMTGDKQENQKYLINEESFIGKKLTVKYQGLTGANKVPRFPIGVRIREEL